LEAAYWGVVIAMVFMFMGIAWLLVGRRPSRPVVKSGRGWEALLHALICGALIGSTLCAQADPNGQGSSNSVSVPGYEVVAYESYNSQGELLAAHPEAKLPAPTFALFSEQTIAPNVCVPCVLIIVVIVMILGRWIYVKLKRLCQKVVAPYTNAINTNLDGFASRLPSQTKATSPNPCGAMVLESDSDNGFTWYTFDADPSWSVMWSRMQCSTNLRQWQDFASLEVVRHDAEPFQTIVRLRDTLGRVLSVGSGAASNGIETALNLGTLEAPKAQSVFFRLAIP
jgi:hypothetical protein